MAIPADIKERTAEDLKEAAADFLRPDGGQQGQGRAQASEHGCVSTLGRGALIRFLRLWYSLRLALNRARSCPRARPSPRLCAAAG